MEMWCRTERGGILWRWWSESDHPAALSRQGSPCATLRSPTQGGASHSHTPQLPWISQTLSPIACSGVYISIDAHQDKLNQGRLHAGTSDLCKRRLLRNTLGVAALREVPSCPSLVAARLELERIRAHGAGEQPQHVQKVHLYRHAPELTERGMIADPQLMWLTLDKSRFLW